MVEDLYVACNWLTATQNSRSKQVDGRNRESAIAARIAELHDRLGGLIKNRASAGNRRPPYKIDGRKPSVLTPLGEAPAFSSAGRSPCLPPFTTSLMGSILGSLREA